MMQPIPNDKQISVVLPAQAWEYVLKALADQKICDALQVFLAIRDQCMRSAESPDQLPKANGVDAQVVQ